MAKTGPIKQTGNIHLPMRIYGGAPEQQHA